MEHLERVEKPERSTKWLVPRCLSGRNFGLKNQNFSALPSLPCPTLQYLHVSTLVLRQHRRAQHRMNPDNIIRSRIGNACDSCKARKVKCDGKLPCSYCARRQRSHACHYSPQRRRTRQQRQQPPRSPRSASDGDTRSRRSGSALNPNLSSGLNHHETHNVHASSSSALSHTTSHSLSSNHNTNLSSGINSNTNHQPNHTLNPRDNTIQNAPASTPAMRPTSSGVDATHEDDTEVPREARLLCDAQGKLIFIGDCAPLSFFQSVRQLVTTKIGQNAFAPHSSRYSVLENAPARASHRLPGDNRVPNVTSLDVPSVVSSYLVTTVGLIDLYDGRLVEDLMMWTNSSQRPDDATSIANFLILAIGCHVKDEDMAQDCFEYARDRAFVNLSGNLSVDTVQVFLLITVYMLCSCQINGAFLFFGISVRAAYSIGIHRTEVNARFGHDIRRQRDRLWKSLRIVDLFLSTSMGRPPATSDVDCTVPYEEKDENGNEVFDLLNSSVQIFLILEMVVVEIYSRKKISLRLTEGISLQLRDWSIRWLRKLKDVIASPVEAQDRAQVAGACQILSTYYYAVMLVSRPFLMYELCRRLSDPALSSSNSRSTSLPSGKSKLADACIDAASLMVDPISDLVGRGVLTGRCPLLV